MVIVEKRRPDPENLDSRLVALNIPDDILKTFPGPKAVEHLLTVERLRCPRRTGP